MASEDGSGRSRIELNDQQRKGVVPAIQPMMGLRESNMGVPLAIVLTGLLGAILLLLFRRSGKD